MSEASPVTWHKRAAGRQVAMLGVFEVAEVSPWLVAGSKHQAHWRVALPGLSAAPRKATDIAEGVKLAGRVIDDWIEAAGLSPATQRELETRAWSAAVESQR